MRFVCDNALGRLAKYLRMLGFDTVSFKNPAVLDEYSNLADPPLFFTKKSRAISYRPTVFIRANRIEEQITEITDTIKSHVDSKSFMTRCIECNTLLVPIDKEDIESRVPEYIYHHHEEFKICLSCNKVYWEGTHAAQMKKLIRNLTSSV
jgi:uncharacterized protein